MNPFSLLLLALVICWSAPAYARQDAATPAEADVAFVISGRSQSTYGHWQEENGALVGQGNGFMLWAGQAIGPGAFRLGLTLRRLTADQDAATLILGANRLTLDTPTGTLTFAGPSHPAPVVLAEQLPALLHNAWIELTLFRNQTTLDVRLNGTSIGRIPGVEGPWDRLGVDPGRGGVALRTFTLSGRAVDLERPDRFWISIPTVEAAPGPQQAPFPSPHLDTLLHAGQPLVLRLTGGRFLRLSATPDTVAQDAATGPIHQTYSPDGFSWEAGAPLAIEGGAGFPYGSRPYPTALIQNPRALLLIAADRSRHTNGFVLSSTDAGATWSPPRELPASLAGRHHSLAAATDGRLVAAFFEHTAAGIDPGDLVAWVGSVDDLLAQREGAYRVHLQNMPADAPLPDRLSLVRQPNNGFFLTYTQPLRHGTQHATRIDFSLSAFDAVVPRPASTIPVVDLDAETHRQALVDREAGQYLGHPTTLLLDDEQTILTAYPKGHGRGPVVMKRSTDGGLTWSERLPTPANWSTSQEVPTLFRTEDAAGHRRIVLFSGLYPIRMAVSDDEGATWSDLEPIGDFGGIVAMGDLKRIGAGTYLALFHDDGRFIDGANLVGDRFRVYQTRSTDGGLTWSSPEVILTHPTAHLCEPGLVRSPDGRQLAMLLRENSRRHNSFITFSTDEGATWSTPRELPASLTGDRHTAKYSLDGRLFISFRDTAHDSPTQGDWVGWVGTYDDLVAGREGQYRVRLKDNKHRWDTAYPGVERLPDGTFVVTTYGHWDEGEEPYILSVRFTLDELDQKAAALQP